MCFSSFRFVSKLTDEWFDMKEAERKAYVQEFNKMSVEDAMKGKTIAATHVPTADVSEFKDFSLLDVRETLLPLGSWTDRVLLPLSLKKQRRYSTSVIHVVDFTIVFPLIFSCASTFQFLRFLPV